MRALYQRAKPQIGNATRYRIKGDEPKERIASVAEAAAAKMRRQ